MKNTFFLLILILLSQSVYSQIDFRKGYIIENSGDTVRGFINYREGSLSYRLCQFRKDDNTASEEYSPDNIKGYGFFDDKVYESMKIQTDNQVKEDNRIFYEVITKGLVSLFKCDENFYIMKGDSTFYRLNNENKIIDKGDYSIASNTPRYLGFLNIVMFDCPAIMERIPGVDYNEKSLTRIVEDYNRQMNVIPVSFKSHKKWSSNSFRISTGVSFTKLKFHNDMGSYFLTAPVKMATSSFIDLAYEFSSPRVSERLSFRTEMILTSDRFTSYYYEPTVSGSNRYYTTIKMAQLMVPLSVSYYFNINNFKPYVNTGVSLAFPFKTTSVVRKEAHEYSEVNTYTSSGFLTPKTQYDFWGGIGAERPVSGKLTGFVELRFSEALGYYSSLEELNSRAGKFMICIGLKIKK